MYFFLKIHIDHYPGVKVNICLGLAEMVGMTFAAQILSACFPLVPF